MNSLRAQSECMPDDKSSKERFLFATNSLSSSLEIGMAENQFSWMVPNGTTIFASGWDYIVECMVEN